MKVFSLLAAFTFGATLSAYGSPAPAASDAGPKTLGDIIQYSATGSAPKSGDYYVDVVAMPDAETRIPPNQCADRSLVSVATAPRASALDGGLGL